MYSKAEKSKIRKDFWTAFGQYMKPVPSAEGKKINWPNYKTGVKHIFFKMKAERDFASIGIEFTHTDPELQQLYFEQLITFKSILHNTLGEEWKWTLHHEDEYGKYISKVEKGLTKVNVLDQNDWPKIISFLKPRIILLDEFWSNMKPAFEEL
ncbi:DUF4268 domain-containing protein [Belliella kenyensis]|uniref:DUF4268 domain-containing protein n=1 Tax=Belliella kenyensis TaxID=1472724 RepID=A0ABV8EJ59_9BACT|nr:DUF4268 domain-containing protein [Belliella kenyensis]MCH7401088.1 DUF4268 domain-containing protein [Belliella kenyensis]MDN3604085.1 DUF4268 domain-containing protein [Belliella kenyensis]